MILNVNFKRIENIIFCKYQINLFKNLIIKKSKRKINECILRLFQKAKQDLSMNREKEDYEKQPYKKPLWIRADGLLSI